MRSGTSFDLPRPGHRGLFTSAAIVCVACAIGCAPPPEAVADPAEGQSADLRAQPAPAYKDIEETFSNEIDQNRWFDLKRQLRQNFDDICGDTFCEGDFSNLEAMSLRCSVATRTGQLKSCVWLFAGSYETITPSTGNVRPVAKFFPCKVEVQGAPAALMDALLAPGGRGPLWQPVPGSGRAIYDSLGDCL
jgi:hypothetical protein